MYTCTSTEVHAVGIRRFKRVNHQSPDFDTHPTNLRNTIVAKKKKKKNKSLNREKPDITGDRARTSQRRVNPRSFFIFVRVPAVNGVDEWIHRGVNERRTSGGLYGVA